MFTKILANVLRSSSLNLFFFYVVKVIHTKIIFINLYRKNKTEENIIFVYISLSVRKNERAKRETKCQQKSVICMRHGACGSLLLIKFNEKTTFHDQKKNKNNFPLHANHAPDPINKRKCTLHIFNPFHVIFPLIQRNHAKEPLKS